MNITGERRLLFVGSRLSTQLGMYSWEGLFNEIAKGRPVENDIRQLVAGGNAYAAADRLSAHLGRVLLENEIRSLIRKCQRSISKEQANSWIVPLSKIATGGAIVTTNWDTLLPDITGWDPLRWPEDRARVITALKSSQPFVLFLHGNINNPPLVITESDRTNVERMLRRPENDLSTIMSIHETLVLGFGFRDPHVENLFLAAETFSGNSNRLLVFVRNSEVAGFKAEHNRIARRCRLQHFSNYDALHSCVTKLASAFDPTASLVRLPDVVAKADFFDIVCAQPYGFRTAENIRAEIRKHPEMLDWSAEYLIQEKWTAKDARTFAVLISGLMNRWAPNSKVVRELDRRCRRASNDPAQIAVFEPVAFALAHKGFPDHQAVFLNAAVQDMEMRRAHVQQTLVYYPTTAEQLGAVQRHMADSRRSGILRANDTARLLTLLQFEWSEVTKRVLPLLDRSVRVLYLEHEDLAKCAEREMNRIRRDRGIDASGIVHL
ncbi:MAG: SIR2 family protein [Terriglobales bacterium]